MAASSSALAADAGFGVGERVRLHEREPVEHAPVELGRVDRDARPAHILGLAVIDAPAVAQRRMLARVLDLLERDLELHGRIVLRGKEDHDIERAQHRDHDRCDQRAVGCHHDLDRDELLVEPDGASEVRAQERAGAGDDLRFGHGAIVAATTAS